MDTSTLIAIVLALNGCSFALCAWDKFAALMGWWRVSERGLIMSAVPFSALGAWLGIRVFRHKTRKPAFQLWVVALLLLQVLIGGWILLSQRSVLLWAPL
jgi:uncharacterized membrane protein YsdA (DUF1294 family)